MTSATEWGMRSYRTAGLDVVGRPERLSTSTRKSEGTGLDGTKYRDW